MLPEQGASTSHAAWAELDSLKRLLDELDSIASFVVQARFLLHSSFFVYRPRTQLSRLTKMPTLILSILLCVLRFHSVRAGNALPLDVVPVEDASPLNAVPGSIREKDRHLQFTDGALSCDSDASPIIQTICGIALDNVNNGLQGRGILVPENAVVVTLNDPKDETIPTEHSCTTTAKLLNQFVRVTLSRDATISFDGLSSFSDPFLFFLEVPGSAVVELSIRERYGIMFFGCQNVGSDSYTLRGGLDTTVKLAIAVALHPEVSSANATVSLRPQAVVLLDLEDRNFDLSSNGKSLLATIWSFVLGLGSASLQFIDDVFSGDSVKAAFDELIETGLLDILRTLTLHFSNSPRLLRDILLPFIVEEGLWDEEKQLKEIESNLEEGIERVVGDILGADADGIFRFSFEQCLYRWTFSSRSNFYRYGNTVVLGRDRGDVLSTWVVYSDTDNFVSIRLSDGSSEFMSLPAHSVGQPANLYAWDADTNEWIVLVVSTYEEPSECP